jgi:hypothetical protein
LAARCVKHRPQGFAGPWAHRNLAARSEHDHALDPIRVERRDHAGDALTKIMANDDDRAIVSRRHGVSRQVRAGTDRSSGQCCPNSARLRPDRAVACRGRPRDAIINTAGPFPSI